MKKTLLAIVAILSIVMLASCDPSAGSTELTGTNLEVVKIIMKNYSQAIGPDDVQSDAEAYSPGSKPITDGEHTITYSDFYLKTPGGRLTQMWGFADITPYGRYSFYYLREGETIRMRLNDRWYDITDLTI